MFISIFLVYLFLVCFAILFAFIIIVIIWKK